MESNKRRCQCSAGCKKFVKMAGRIYARGHNPNFWGRKRKTPAEARMTVAEFQKHKDKAREQFGLYASEKKIRQCPAGCGYYDGVRGLRRHRASCPNLERTVTPGGKPVYTLKTKTRAA